MLSLHRDVLEQCVGADPMVRVVCRTMRDAYDAKLREDYEQMLVNFLGNMRFCVNGRVPTRYLLSYKYRPIPMDPIYVCSACGTSTYELCGCERCKKREKRRQFMKRIIWYVVVGSTSCVFATHSIAWVI